PSGRKEGKRWLVSPRDRSNPIIGAASPPVASTRCSPPLPRPAKTITSSLFQVPPPTFRGLLQSVIGGPPEASIFLSLPSAKKPIDRLSGDQKGYAAPSVPFSDCA